VFATAFRGDWRAALNRYLVQYSYPKGNLWAFVLAESQEQVETRFRDIVVYAKPPN
jgi:hypothetical protein